MTEQPRPPLEGAPTWVRAAQAGLIGLVTGLTLHLLLSLSVVQGSSPAQPAPGTCATGGAVREVPAATAPASRGSRAL